LGQLAVSKFITEGVDVWGTWDQLGAGNVSSQDDALCQAGVSIRVEDWGGKLHHKVGVIDAFGSDPTVVTGSFNWTASANDSNDENTLIIHNTDIATAFYDEMVKLYTTIDQAPCQPAPAPMADFTADVVSGAAPLTVTFSNLSKGIISEWVWSFGDGITTTMVTPQHVYMEAGVYTVTLTARGDSLEDTRVRNGYIMVQENEEPDFIYLPLVVKP
jgi:PKD repeat protein